MLLECLSMHRHQKFSTQSLRRYLRFCYCACWDRPPSWLSCMIQCLRRSGIHILGIPLPKSLEVCSGKLESTPNTTWQYEGHTKAQEPQIFLFKRSDYFRFLSRTAKSFKELTKEWSCASSMMVTDTHCNFYPVSRILCTLELKKWTDWSSSIWQKG